MSATPTFAGQRVYCVEGYRSPFHPQLEVVRGTEYTVTTVARNGNVEVDNQGCWWLAERFRVVEP